MACDLRLSHAGAVREDHGLGFRVLGLGFRVYGGDRARVSIRGVIPPSSGHLRRRVRKYLELARRRPCGQELT